jgi:hypothetical protein
MIDEAPKNPKHSWGKWPKIKPETVAPLRDGRPDMYNHQPTRFVSLEEATGRDWNHFWTGQPCVTGHRAARYVSNPSVCTDCQRIEKGKAPVYGRGVPELEAARKRNYTQKNTVAGPAQPTHSEKMFLQKYAELKDFSLAAYACNRTESEFLAILSWNQLFRDSVNRLEESLGIARTQKITEEFDWDDDKRKTFLITYANTADMKESLRSVRATNVQFHKELVDNPDFQRDFDEAAQLARNVFDHAASSSAIKGDSRLLGRIASNLFPEKFGENMKVDLNVKQNMTAAQINAEITQLLSGFNRQGLLSAPRRDDGDAVDAEYQLAEPEHVDETAGDTETEEANAGPDPNSDLVSGSD